MNSPKISEGYIYPVKSCAGIRFQVGEVMEIAKTGPLYDREWMVVGADDLKFRTQRDKGFEQLALVHPSLVKISPGPMETHLRLNADRLDNFVEMPLEHHQSDADVLIETEVWGSPAEGIVYEEASEWMSDFLRQNCLVIRHVRKIMFGRSHVPDGTPGTFADGSHLLGISEATLAELNEHLKDPVGMDRFRPNLVFSGVQSREENNWRHVKFGSVEACGVKPCERCKIVNINQETGEFTKGGVLKVLADQFRGSQGNPLFGENFIVQNTGIITIGDPVEVIEATPKGFHRDY